MSRVSDWIGREMRDRDVATAAAVGRLAAVLDHDGTCWPADALPPLGHWLFHLPDARQSELGIDGHPQRGGFLPPIEQPRRMWAGSRIRFVGPIPFGAEMEKKSTILGAASKTGASGEMVLMTIGHEVTADGKLAVAEEQDLVYLNIGSPAPPKPVPRPEPDSVRPMIADATLLFRFSALTFNAHRIHYDLDYAREAERYPALVVHGPLQAMLLVDHAVRRNPGRKATAFEFRARSPLYAERPFALCGAGDELWTRDEQENVAMTAKISWE